MIKRLFLILFSVLLVLFSCSCDNNELKLFNKSYFDYFDTVTTLKYYCVNVDNFNNCCELVEEKLIYYNKLFDIYKDYDGVNNLKTVNDNAGIKPVKVDNEIILFLKYCKKVYKLTKGNVNIFLGPVLKIWHKYRQEGKRLPSMNELQNADKCTDINLLVINEKDSTVYLSKKGCSIDVGAIAKGYVGEILKDVTIKFGISNGLINFGGNIITIGKKPNNDLFEVGITNPQDTKDNVFSVNVSDKCVVTSGDYERYYTVDNINYCHIISPKTLMPSNTNKSVTIISDDSALADALSTALFILDYNDGMDLVDLFENCEACVIDKEMKIHYSNGFKKYIK